MKRQTRIFFIFIFLKKRDMRPSLFYLSLSNLINQNLYTQCLPLHVVPHSHPPSPAANPPPVEFSVQILKSSQDCGVPCGISAPRKGRELQDVVSSGRAGQSAHLLRDGRRPAAPRQPQGRPHLLFWRNFFLLLILC